MTNNNVEKIPLSIVNFSDEDITPIETKEGGFQNLIDLKQVKSKRGAEFCHVEDMKTGLIVSCQSFKYKLDEVGALCLDLFKQIKAEYVCSDNSAIIKDYDEVKIGDTENVNGIILGLARAQISPVSKYLSVLLYTDGKEVVLTDSTPYNLVQFTDGSLYNFSLFNSSGSMVRIGVNSSTANMEYKEFTSLGGLELFLISLEGISPDRVEAVLMAGKGKVTFSTYGTMTQKVNHEDREYILTLRSVSFDDNVLIESLRCSNDSANLIEVVQNASNNTTNNVSINTTIDNSSTTNNSVNNTITNSSLNGTENDTNSSETNGGGFEYFSIFKTVEFYILAAACLIFFIFLAKYLKNRALEEKAEKMAGAGV